MKSTSFMFGYPIKKSTANAYPKLLQCVLKYVLLCLFCSFLLAHNSYADGKKDQRAIEKSRQQFKSLSPAERKKVQDRYKWYKDLPPEKQKEIRERWKKSGS